MAKAMLMLLATFKHCTTDPIYNNGKEVSGAGGLGKKSGSMAGHGASNYKSVVAIVLMADDKFVCSLRNAQSIHGRFELTLRWSLQRCLNKSQPTILMRLALVTMLQTTMSSTVWESM